MGYTITEKILARAAGLGVVRAGDAIRARPDFVLAYDWPGQTDTSFRDMKKEFAVDRLIEPGRFGMFIDHLTPTVNEAEEEFHKGTRRSCEEYGIALIENQGIGHQVATEIGFAVPGAFVVHFDGHVSQLGTYGTLAIGMRRSHIEAYVRERVTICVPHTVRIDFSGRLCRGVMARDVFHHLVRKLGTNSCRFQMLELGGNGIADLSSDGLQTITGLAMFVGAISSIVNPDEKRLAYALPRARKRIEPLYSDPDAHYAARHEIDLSVIEPLIVIPPSPANTRDLRDCAGLEVQVGYIGSCVSGRLEDLRAAAEVLKGRTIKQGFVLNVVPTSRQIMETASREGTIATLIEAGARIHASSCDYCYGRLGTLKPNQRGVSTGTLNVRGRMGDLSSEIFLCSGATVAASAIDGAIADPRRYLGDAQ